MEFPFGHHHHHHRRDDDEDNERNSFPPHMPLPFDGPQPFPQPAGVHHVSHQPPPPFFQQPPPPFFEASPHPHRPSPYSDDPHAEHRHQEHSDDVGSLERQQTVRVFTKAEENYSLSIRDGKVILAKQNPSDRFQHWIKDMRYSTNVKDEESFPAFALVNKATGEAIKHSFGATQPVQLVPYNPKFPDESVLWTESKDLGDGFRCIRMVNNISLNFDAFNGDEQHGGVHEGTVIVLWEWLKGKNQRWKIVPY